jgi:hypothetical protein
MRYEPLITGEAPPTRGVVTVDADRGAVTVGKGRR